MKKKSMGIIALLAIASVSLLGFSFYNHNAEIAMSKNEIESLIVDSYVNGAFNKLNAEAMEKGFHKDFAIFSAKGNELGRYEIKTWVAGVKRRKANSETGMAPKKTDHKIVQVDVTGNAAMAKIELFEESKKIYTDYLHFLKFDEGWKIVGKVYYAHK